MVLNVVGSGEEGKIECDTLIAHCTRSSVANGKLEARGGRVGKIEREVHMALGHMALGARSLIVGGKPGGVGGHADRIGCNVLRTHDTGSPVVN